MVNDLFIAGDDGNNCNTKNLLLIHRGKFGKTHKD